MNKKRILLISLCFLFGCNQATTESTSEVLHTLPKKEISDSALASESPIDATNIDDYLFLEDVQYFDLRTNAQVEEEGGIAGFTVLPFYGVLVSLQPTENVLFTMQKDSEDKSYLGDVGTFEPNYEESEFILHRIFDESKQIVFISTAGVESAYMINLLKQYGYDGSKLYNAGTFTNGMGNIIAYKDYAEHKHYIEPITAYHTNVTYDFSELTPIEE